MADRKRPVVWSPEAHADLSQIWKYYVEVAGQQTAANIVRDIDRACRLIEDHAFGGRARDEVRPDLRSIAVRPHVIFYRVEEATVEIVRVLDGRRDLDELFAADQSAP